METDEQGREGGQAEGLMPIPDVFIKHRRRGRAPRQQTYVRVAVEPCIRADGNPSKYVVWGSLCRKCGRPFYTTSGTSRSGLHSRCPQHQRGGPTKARLARHTELMARYQWHKGGRPENNFLGKVCANGGLLIGFLGDRTGRTGLDQSLLRLFPFRTAVKPLMQSGRPRIAAPAAGKIILTTQPKPYRQNGPSDDPFR
jgi:hypothetical protein